VGHRPNETPTPENPGLPPDTESLWEKLAVDVQVIDQAAFLRRYESSPATHETLSALWQPLTLSAAQETEVASTIKRLQEREVLVDTADLLINIVQERLLKMESQITEEFGTQRPLGTPDVRDKWSRAVSGYKPRNERASLDHDEYRVLHETTK